MRELLVIEEKLFIHFNDIRGRDEIMGVASLVLGIITTATGLIFGGLSFYTLPFVAVGIILGVIGMRKPENRKIATIGLILCIIGLAISLYWITGMITSYWDGNIILSSI